MHKSKHKYKSGFSLVELSVSLVIISFLIAGVMQGRNLVENAKLRAIIAETSSHKVSVNSFLAKYEEFPGDFTESVAYWGATTADGDGDGKIDFVNTLGTPTYEGYRAWQHLYYAGMINGEYVGTETTDAAEISTDIPPSKAGGGFFIEYGVFGMTDNNILVLGMPKATAAAPILVNGVLKPKQAYEIDSKIDDGEPSEGSVHALDGDDATAETCVVAATSIYNLQSSGKDCTMGFKLTEQ